jgi:BirA family biotin operon repressor/biotin-[acetyl-CoA-carboxylase] ligase
MHPSDLFLERIEAALKTRRLGRSLEVRELTESTNDDAREAARAGAPHGHVVVADAQRRGRGARGHSWSSPAGTDLYLSVVVRIDVPAQQLAPLTLAVGLGVAEAADVFLPTGQTASIKWPNDVWVQRKKLAGILVESASQGQEALPVIVGIGLNVNRRAFPEGLDTAPTSLALERGDVLERALVLAELLGGVERWIERFERGELSELVSALEARLALRGERASCDEVEGVVSGIAASGALRFRVDGVQRELYAGRLRPL